MTYHALRRELTEQLRKAGCDSPAFEARCLVEGLGGLPSGQLPAYAEREAPAALAARLREAVRERAAGRPLQYLLGHWDFLSLTLEVGEGVLIPRPDTELLCETAAARLRTMRASAATDGSSAMDSACATDASAAADPFSPVNLSAANASSPLRLLDLCAGSGCVGLGVASLMAAASHAAKHSTASHSTATPAVTVTAVERSEEALSYLRRNCARYPALHVTPVQADVLRNAAQFGGGWDAILCNPPYIPTAVLPTLSREVQHEPLMALDGGEGDGLMFYRCLAAEWVPLLRAGGFCAVEVGIGQAAAVEALFRQAGLHDTARLRDLGGIERVVIGTRIAQDCSVTG